ncbi:heterokaryon incompatibility protein-domain-containing protein, partial [Pisolithus croceorrhizus]
MRLLNVRAVLDRESNIANTVGVSLHYNVLEELDDTGTEYAILSHRWGKEVNYSEMVELTTMPKEKRNEVRRREGYQKILKSCEQAVKDALEWLWVDTCCIDKRSSSELSEAVNSMFRWYQNSKKCYVYLHDLTEPTLPKKADRKTYGNSNGWPEWFSRGWTLQELIAPEDVQFFNKGWARLGTKRSLEDTLWRITRIPPDVLLDSAALRNICVAQIMSWAADRKTSRVEDRAYSLLGLFGVSMPMLYGEGKRAFQRIQLEIMRASNDHSIFAW